MKLIDGLDISNFIEAMIKQSLKIILLFVLISIPQMTVHAQTDLCPPEEKSRIEQFVALAQTYEAERAWEKAADTYAEVATSTCNSLAEVGREGLNRTLPHQIGWAYQLGTKLLELSRTTIIAFIQLLGAILGAIILFYMGKFIIQRLDEQRTWTILPFTDLSGGELGEMVTESLVNTIHETRFIHNQSPMGLINLIESSDLPSFSGMKQRDGFVSALSGLDSFDVSGFGLPIGSILVSITRWLDLGGRRLEGNIRRIEDKLEISVRLEEGRSSKCLKIWRESGEETSDLKTSTTLYELQERLSYRILLDIIPVDWGTKSAEALRSFTNGMRYFQQIDSRGSYLRNEQILQKAREAFQKAQHYDPTYQLAMYNLALVELNLGNNDRAIELLKVLEEVI